MNENETNEAQKGSAPPVGMGRYLGDLMGKIAPAAVLAVAGWALMLHQSSALHEQRIVASESHISQLQAELAAKTDRLTMALDAQREAISGLRAEVSGLQQSVQALVRALEKPSRR